MLYEVKRNFVDEYTIFNYRYIGTVDSGCSEKTYSRRVNNGAYSFAASGTFVAMLFFLVSSGGALSFSVEFLLYAVGFAVSYSIAILFSLLAVSTGSLSLTALVISCSLFLPTLFGLLFLHEPVSALLLVGIAMLLVALVLINLEKKGQPKQLTSKWLLYVALAFLGNGMCSVVQKAQQTASGGAYKNEFMIVALSIASVVLFVTAGMQERRSLLVHMKAGLPWYGLSGCANGLVNLLIMVLSKEIAASVMFPIISAGGIIMTFVIAMLVYREHLSRWQIAGVVLGATSVVFLSL